MGGRPANQRGQLGADLVVEQSLGADVQFGVAAAVGKDAYRGGRPRAVARTHRPAGELPQVRLEVAGRRRQRGSAAVPNAASNTTCLGRPPTVDGGRLTPPRAIDSIDTWS